MLLCLLAKLADGLGWRYCCAVIAVAARQWSVIVIVIPGVVAPVAVVVPVGRGDVSQVEMYVVVAIDDIATEARVGQVIVGDDYRGAFFKEIDVYITVIDAPADVVGHVVP